MQDQLIIWMAIAAGTSRLICAEPTLHTRTAAVVAQQLLPGARISIAPLPPRGAGSGGGSSGGGVTGSGARGQQQLYLIECHGAGVRARG
jgi:RNA 3'-terminal phosphate cyclase (ATP)